MANEIKDKIVVASTAITITLASLANGSARQSTEIDNTSNLVQDILLAVNIKLGTSPTANKEIPVYLIRNDNNGIPIRDDGAGAVDAAITILNAPLVGALVIGSAPSTGDILKGLFLIHRPGPKFVIAVKNDSGVALDVTGANHVINYVGLNPEAQ